MKRTTWRVLVPGLLVAATGVGAGDLATSALTGSRLGVAILWAVLVGCAIKLLLNESVARYQLAHGETLLFAVVSRAPKVLRIVRLPGAVPAFFAGLRISSTYAIFGAVIGEGVGARGGLGLFITRSQTGYRTDRVFVAVIVIAAISMALFALVELAARLAMPWRARTEQESS